jgi:hypothetical protein
MPRWIARCLLTTTLGLLALACSHSAAPSEPALPNGNSLALTSVSPAAGTRLTPGSTVTFRAVLRYAVTASANGIGAEMQDQSGNVLASTATTQVPVGSGLVTLSSTFQMPASGSTPIVIAYLLFTNEAAGAAITGEATASFPVGP